tara:strand:+ start:323 stop:955 length:633 start_codon:yes stop_codon:yes gene_type:complete
MKIKKGDIISLDYAGTIKDEDVVFDLTDPELLKKTSKKLPPKVIKVGEGDILPGLDKKLPGKEIGKIYTIQVDHMDAFGKKDPKLLKLESLSVFKKQNIDPYPGMQLDLGGNIATVRTVGAGRVTLDLNHPLAGKDLTYKIRINKKITDLKEQIQGLVHLAIPDAEVELKEKTATINIKQKVNKQLEKVISDNIKQRFPELSHTKVTTKP